MLDKITPNMEVGILPIPLSDDLNVADKLPVGVRATGSFITEHLTQTSKLQKIS